MKSLILLLALFTTFSSLSQRNETVFDTHHKGNYLAISFGGTKINDNSTGVVGIRAMSISNKVAYGLVARGLFSGREPYIDGNRQAKYYGLYGGFMVNPTLFSVWAFSISATGSIGGGWIGQYEYITDGYTIYTKNKSVFGYVEPGLEAELQLTYDFKLSIGGYYMFKHTVEDWSEIDPSLGRLSVLVCLKWGFF